MFSIATPQTVQLIETPWIDPALPVVSVDPGKPIAPFPSAGTVSFDHAGDDVAKCRMTVTLDGKVFTHTFGVNGACIASTFEDDGIQKAKEAAAKQAEADAKVEQVRQQDAAAKQNARELKTTADTTAADISYDAPVPANG